MCCWPCTNPLGLLVMLINRRTRFSVRRGDCSKVNWITKLVQ